jgi:hypothetical protein
MAGCEWCNGLFTWVRDYHSLAQGSLLPRPEEQIGVGGGGGGGGGFSSAAESDFQNSVRNILDYILNPFLSSRHCIVLKYIQNNNV